MYTTGDGGTTWEKTYAVSGQFANGSMFVRDSNHTYMANGTTVVATTDGGRSWTAFPLPVNVLGKSRLSFGDPLHGWIAGTSTPDPGSGPTGPGAHPYLLATRDGGATWYGLI